MNPEQLAKARRRQREALARSAATAVGRMWRKIDPANIAASWASTVPDALAAVTAVQTAAADSADDYLDQLAGGSDTRVVAARLAGVASDGRDLAQLLFQPAVTALQTIGRGGGTARGLAAGGFATDMIVRTQVADAGRVADQLALIAHQSMAGYVRVVSAGACSRCVVLAGRFYSWSAGFDRHPRCHCVHAPSTSAEASVKTRTQPRAYFDSLSKAEQDKAFTKAGAEAIRLGADIGQVVNARRGALGLSSAGARITAAEARLLRGGNDVGRLRSAKVFGEDLFVTTEGTTTRGVAGVRLGAKVDGRKQAGARYRSARPPRLMPESILKIAGNDRDEAIRLLQRNGYLRAKPGATTARRPVPARPPVPAETRPFAERAGAAASGPDALAAPGFGISRRPRPAEFTPEMSRAVNTYTGAEYGAINAHLRGTRLPYGYSADDVTPVIAALDKALDASRLSRDVVVHRGVLDAGTMFGDRLAGDLTGMVWREDAYLSTTAKPGKAAAFAGTGQRSMVMRVLAPAGTRAIEASGMDLEAEVLLRRGVRLRVVADRGVSPAGVRHIDVEVLDG